MYEIRKTYGTYWIVVKEYDPVVAHIYDGKWFVDTIWPGSFIESNISPLEVLINTGISQSIIEKKIIPMMLRCKNEYWAVP